MIYVALFGGLLPASIVLSALIVEYRKSLSTKMHQKEEYFEPSNNHNQ
ncbi:MAG: hypothetical protein ACOCUE_02375 [Candidatus Izemoplasmataceae bacterium]